MDKLKQQLLNTNCFIDNKYLNLYCKLIKFNLYNKKEKYITSSHHIVPKCYFKINNLVIDNSKENKINLKYTDHILAHYYLCLCSKGSIKYRLINAFLHLVNRKWSYNNFNPEIDLEEYQNLYTKWCLYRRETQQHNKYRLGCKNSEEHRRKISKANKGRKFSELTCKKISENKKGIIFSVERNKKLSNSLKGKKRTEEQKQHMKKPRKNRGSHQSKEWIEKRTKKLKGRTYSEDTLKKMSLSHKGRKPSDLAIQRKIETSTKKIICVEDNIIYNSAKEACKVYSCDRTTIGKYARNGGQFKGKTFKYVE